MKTLTIYPYHISVDEDGEDVGQIDYDNMYVALGNDPSHGVISLGELLETWSSLHPERGVSFAV